MTELEAMEARHSVRNYLNKEIEPEKAEKITQLIEACNKEGNLHLQFLPDAGKTFSRFLNKMMGLGSAKSVIACVGPYDETLEERVGYYGEKVVLFAQTLGLNTCWAGTFSEKGVPAKVRPGERLVIVIAIGYGANQGVKRRTKTYEDVVDTPEGKPEWFKKGVELALLAPTAINQQKFRFRLQEDGSVAMEDLGGPFSKVDQGIVRYHFDVGVTPSDASAKREEELLVSPLLQESAIGEREARRQSGNDDRGE